MASANDFIIDFRIEGSGQKDLDAIQKSLSNIANEAGKGGTSGHKGMAGSIEDAGKGAHALEGGLAKVAAGAGAAVIAVMAIAHGLEEAMGFGVGLMKAGASGFGLIGKGVETLVHKGAEFEQMLLRIQGSGKSEAEAQKIMKSALALTAELPFTEADAVRMATTLSTVHIDATKGIGEMSYAALAKQGKIVDSLAKNTEFMQGAGQTKKITPLEIFGDYLATIGELGTGYQGMAIHELTQYVEYGMTQSKKTFGLFHHELREGEKKFKKMNAQEAGQERMKLLMEILGKRGALGLSKAASETHGGVMSMYKGLLDKITVAVMEPGNAGGAMTKLNKGMLALYRLIADYFDETTEKGQKFLHGLKEMVGFIVNTMVSGMKLLGETLSKVFDFASKNAGMLKLAAVLTIVTSGLLVAAGAAITFASGLGLAALAGTILAAGLMVAVNVIGMMFLPLTLAAGVAVLALVAGAYLLDAAWASASSGGLNDVYVLVNALVEAFTNWKDETTSLSEETADALEKSGMSQFFLDVVTTARTAQVYLQGFAEGFSSRFKFSTTNVREAFERLWNRIVDIFSILSSVTTSYGSKLDETSGKGKSFGDALAAGLGVVADALAIAINGIVLFSNALGPIVWTGGLIYGIFGGILNVIELVGDVVIGSIVAGLQIAVSYVMALANALTTAAVAAGQLAAKDPAGAAETMAAGAEKTAMYMAQADAAKSAFTNRIKSDVADLDAVVAKANKTMEVGTRMRNLTTETASERKKSNEDIERWEPPDIKAMTEEMAKDRTEGPNPNTYQLKPLPPPPVPATPGAGEHGADSHGAKSQTINVHNKTEVELKVGGEQFGKAVVEAVKEHSEMLGLNPGGKGH